MNLKWMYKQLTMDPYCKLPWELDKLTLAQLVLYFTSEDEVKGIRDVGKDEIIKRIIASGKKPISRAEFLKNNRDVRERKLKERKERKEKELQIAMGKHGKKQG